MGSKKQKRSKNTKPSDKSMEEKRWSRRIPTDDDEEDDEPVGRSTRSRRRLVTTSYKEPTSEFEDSAAENSEFDETMDQEQKDDEPGLEDEDDDNDDDDEEEDLRPKKRTRRPLPHQEQEDLENIEGYQLTTQEPEESASPKKTNKGKKAAKDDDDDDYYSDEDEDQEDFDIESDGSEDLKPRQKPFIIKDDDEDFDDDEEYGSKSRRSKPRTKRRNHNLSIDGTFGLPNDRTDPNQSQNGNDLLDELADLRDEDDTYRKNKLSRLRANTKKVDYAIPPPLGDSALYAFTPRGGGGRRTGTLAGPMRRLYPTGGPFGGGDVVSIFNNLSNSNNVTSNQLTGGVDDDSSDDEILPVGGAPNRRSSSATVPFNAKGKKNANADTDPLGVDMNIDFSHVGGLSNYIDQLKEMVALPLLYPEVYQRFGITPPRGVLFHGPPGTGKTLMARALAASCSSKGQKITFFMRKGADCLSKWVGEAERQLRLLFEEAKKQQPCIIFFDEIDGLAPVRSSKQEQIHASIVSTLLALMDGMDNRGQVIVIGATNRPDAVDPALRRPGRFDREFYFPLPDIKAREEILQIHTKKWEPSLPEQFVSKVAQLTKGYGGADLRALCTEAALNSIQRRYPQIYASNDKLKIDPSTISVSARDFMKAIEKIVPSSARSLSSGSAPIPEHLSSLLDPPLSEITGKLDKLIPRSKKLSTLEEAKFIDPTENDADGGFGKHELIKRLESSRVHRPRMLICGEPGNGQQYLGAAVLNYLEGFNVQSLDLSSLFGDSTRSIENAIIQTFVEARRHKPSIIFIPNVDIWYETIPDSAKSTFAGLLRSLSSNERVLLLGVCYLPKEEIPMNLKLLFGLSGNNIVSLPYANMEQRLEFFKPLWKALQMKPTEYLDSRKPRKLEVLQKIDIKREDRDKDEDLKSFEKQDMQLRNTLKIKLSGLMDLLKPRYKKFKKPIIDDIHLLHFFEPLPLDAPTPLYVKDGDMILETTTGRKFYNIDLDTIEERLWNGYYLQPKEFMKDIEMIYKDCITSNDRDRIIKASEMFSNTQVHIEEMSVPEFIDQCKSLKRRELKRRAVLAEELREQQEAKRLEIIPESEVTKVGVGAGSQLQIQAQPDVPEDQEQQPEEEEYKEEVSSDRGKLIVKPLSDPITVEDSSSGIGSEETLVSSNEPHSGPVEEPEAIKSQKHLEIEEKEKKREEDKDQTDREKQEAEDNEEKEEKEEEIPDPPFELDQEQVTTKEQLLALQTSDLSVEQLEQFNAALMEIIWEDHHLWDRNGTLDNVEREMAVLLEALKDSYN